MNRLYYHTLLQMQAEEIGFKVVMMIDTRKNELVQHVHISWKANHGIGTYTIWLGMECTD